MIDVKDDTRRQELLMAINEAIGYRIENDDIDASVRARACLMQACIEIAHINDDGRRKEILDMFPKEVRKLVSGARALILNPPKDH